MRRLVCAALGALLAGIGTAWAEPAVYSVKAMGTGVPGTSKCATYQIAIDLTVDGKAIKGSFKQQGRPEHSFAATLDDKGAFKTRAEVGEGNTMDITGSLSDSDGHILLDGYCKFEGKLTRTK